MPVLTPSQLDTIEQLKTVQKFAAARFPIGAKSESLFQSLETCLADALEIIETLRQSSPH